MNPAAKPPDLPPELAVLDWRRQVFALYAAVRADPDPEAGHRLWCATRDDLARHHPASPVPPGERPGFGGLAVAAYDPALRFEVAVSGDVAPDRIVFETGTDGAVAFTRIGRIRIGDLGRLDVWWLAGYGGGLFVPLKDASAGSRTYGGGRYLLDTTKGADLGRARDTLIVDLNFAYNPSCAYDPAWACPLAPPGNVLDVAVEAGELLP